MKRKQILLPVLMLAILLSSMLVFSSYKTREAADDIWKALGISQQSGTENIRNSFLNGYLYYYGARNVRNIALSDRKAIAQDLLTYTKQYVSGAAFKKQYEDLRNNSKPQEPAAGRVRSIEEIQKEELAKTEKSIKETEKTLKEVSAEIAKSLQPILEMQKQNLKDYKDPKNPLFASIQMGEKYQFEDSKNRYQEDMESWKKNYPEDMKVFVAARLQKMLDATKGIDYNAALVEKYNKKRFVNPAYEGKNTEWKQGFRAGRDVTETARAFAEQWLKELR